MKKLTLILTICFCLLAVDSFATTYYVRKGGNDNCTGLYDQDGSSGNCAKLTIQAAVNLATTAGDTVTVHVGNYVSDGRISTAASGTPISRITISAYTGETVITKAWTISHNYITVNGFAVKAGSNVSINDGGAVNLSGTYGIFTNGDIYDAVYTTVSGQYPVAVAFNGSHNTLSETTIRGDGTLNYGWYIVVSFENTYALVENCIIKDILDCERVFNGTEGASSNADYAIMRGNEVYNLLTPVPERYAHVDIMQTINRSGNSMNNWTFENNYIHDCDSQGIGYLEAPASKTANLIVRNNVAANLKNSSMATPGNGTVYYNNTFYRIGYGVGQDPCVCYWGNATCTSKNNIVIGATSQTSANACYGGSKGSGGVFDHDYWSNNSYLAIDTDYFDAWYSGGSGSINGGNPYFIAAYDNCITNTCNFHLASNSPLKEAGTDLSAYFTTDKDGNTRTVPWSIGAYEYIGGDTTPPTVTAFVIPSTSNYLSISITTFTATDDVGVTGYCLTEVASYSGCSWYASAPSTYIFTTPGNKTLYAWAKDAANNISSSLNDTIVLAPALPSNLRMSIQ